MATKEQKKKVSRIKVKKKVWYKIFSPPLFGSKEIGESYLTSPASAVGRTLQVNLKELTGNIKDQNVYIGLEIVRVEGSALHTSIISYKLTPTYVKRVVRKNTSRLDDYFILRTKNGRKVILKSLMITLNQTKRSVETQLRKKLYEQLDEEMKKTEFDVFVSNLVSYRIQAGIKKKLSKVYPLKEIAIRVMQIDRKEKLPVPQESKNAEADIKEDIKEDIKKDIKKDALSAGESVEAIVGI